MQNRGPSPTAHTAALTLLTSSLFAGNCASKNSNQNRTHISFCVQIAFQNGVAANKCALAFPELPGFGLPWPTAAQQRFSTTLYGRFLFDWFVGRVRVFF